MTLTLVNGYDHPDGCTALLTAVTIAEGMCVRCDRTWPESDLSEDGDGDPVCVDCHAIDPGDDRTEHRAYTFAGR
ncbi:hypothetical protein [Streptacidiphilus albus]|uniref:hypothetical protein n=1 Tax=Streptacidiphilus albus TaxID=105425 RepID=UPI00054C6E9D|nr:hypothetical protein [Streptacidiphilus albus]